MELAFEVSFDETKTKLKDVLKVYNGLSSENVIDQGKFTRTVLTDTVFALKDIAEELVGLIELQSITATSGICNKLVEKFSDMLAQTMPKAIKSAMDANSLSTGNRKETQVEKEKFSLLIDKGNEEVFNTRSWNEVAKQNINDKLKNIPVKKTNVTKNGQGYILLPNKEAQEQAKLALQEDFVVTESVTTHKKILPKLVVLDIEGYSKDDKTLLKEAITDKNECVRSLANAGKVLEVVYIDERKRHAVLKVSPEIRNAVMKHGTVFIGMQSHKAKDHIHVIQCFACQKFGHKQGSEHCEMRGGHRHCLYCSGDHQSKDCRVKNDPNKYKCINCINSKNKFHQDHACHTSTSNFCPFVAREKEAALKRTAVSEAKNV